MARHHSRTCRRDPGLSGRQRAARQSGHRRAARVARLIFALDTNSIAYFFRGEGRVRERLLAKRPRDIAVPALVAYDLRYGIARLQSANRRAAQLECFLSATTILAFDDDCARIAGQVRAKLEQTGEYRPNRCPDCCHGPRRERRSGHAQCRRIPARRGSRDRELV